MRRAIVVVLVIAVLAWLTWRVAQVPRGPSGAGAPSDSAAAGFKAARLYFAAPTGDRLVSETREMLETADLHGRVAALVGELDKGPKGPGVAALPAGTAVLHVYLDDRGLMTLDLSRAFRQNFHGGSTAEYLAVASLVRTIGANLPEVRRVLVVCGGAPLATLGGHLPLDRPFDVGEL